MEPISTCARIMRDVAPAVDHLAVNVSGRPSRGQGQPLRTRRGGKTPGYSKMYASIRERYAQIREIALPVLLRLPRSCADLQPAGVGLELERASHARRP